MGKTWFLIWLIFLFDIPKFTVWVTLTIIYITSYLIYQSPDSKLILLSDTTYRPRSSCKWQRVIIIFFVGCITIVIQLWRYIISIILFYIINGLIEHNIYRFHRYNSKEGRFIFCFGAKLIPIIWLILFSSLPKIIAWVLPTIIYIISHFIFKSTNSKPIIFYDTA